MHVNHATTKQYKSVDMYGIFIIGNLFQRKIRENNINYSNLFHSRKKSQQLNTKKCEKNFQVDLFLDFLHSEQKLFFSTDPLSSLHHKHIDSSITFLLAHKFHKFAVVAEVVVFVVFGYCGFNGFLFNLGQLVFFFGFFT